MYTLDCGLRLWFNARIQTERERQREKELTNHRVLTPAASIVYA